VTATSRAERGCIFCGGKPLSTEHAIPAWVGEVLHALEPPGADWETHYMFGTSDDTSERRHQAPDNRPVVKVNAVCEPCNNGWMAALESAVAPIMGPMIRGELVTVGLGAQLLLATWCVKTALVLEFLRSDFLVATPDIRQALMRDQRPPETFRVRLAQIDDPTRHPLRFQTLVGSTEQGPQAKADGLCSTLLIGNLVVQVWGGEGAGPIDLTKAGTAISNAVMIWPPVPGVASWPPRVALNEETAEVFMREPFQGADRPGFLDGW
jgi:predicted alpha/beta hydrolase family esterase